MIKTFIVDDEQPALSELKRFLDQEGDFAVVGEAHDGDEAVRGIKDLNPRVVFLDIHMPKLNGLEVASTLSELDSPPVVVFVTAYDQHAIAAFELSALDYVLKPFDDTRFSKTCQRIRETLLEQVLVKDKLASLKGYLEHGKPVKIMGRKRNSRDRIFIQPEDVLYFHVQLTDVTAHLKDGQELLVSATLKSLIDLLDAAHFQQVHRAHVVNLDQVDKVTPMFSGNFELVLKGATKTKIPLSRRYAKQLKKSLNW
jgi:two-component system, LytTR family, response regulator LytT